MSVLKSKRTESKAEYVNVANAIYIETINFLTRISARYSRLIAEPVAKLAGEVIDHAEKANSIYPSDDQRRQLRKAHLLEARHPGQQEEMQDHPSDKAFPLVQGSFYLDRDRENQSQW